MVDTIRTESGAGLRGEALALVAAASTATTAYGRADLTRRLAATRRRLADPALHILVIGEFKQGKSSLVNAILGAPVCPVDDDVATAVPTAVRYAETPVAVAVYEPPPDDIDAEPVREEIPFDEVVNYVTEAHNPDNRRRLQVVEVGLPRQLLAGGLVLVDTPGVGGLGSVHSATTLGALPMAEAVIFVSDSSQEYTEPELAFLRTARDLCPNVLCVLTKADFYPRWRTIEELNRRHLEAARMRVDVFPVSSPLRARALRDEDADLNAESGLPPLIAALNDGVGAGADRLATRAAAADLLSVCGQLRLQFESERQVLADPAGQGALIERLGAVREQADRLRSVAARWQQTLGDGIGDLSGDIDHDLRARTRDSVREAEEAIDGIDPGEVWDEFEPWLYRRLTEDVVASYALLQARSAELAGNVEAIFDEDQGEIGVSLPETDPGAVLETIRASAAIDAQRMGKGEQGLSLLRGSYGGMAMFGMFGHLVGLTMMSPAVLAIGLLMGRKAVQTEKDRQVLTQRNQAKAAVRRYADEVTFTVGKDSRDAVRRIHRQLRDHFTARAEELHRSTTEALQAVQQAIAGDEADRQGRRRAVEAELARIDALRRRVLTLAPDLEAGRSSEPARPVAAGR
ncbi:MAG: hypothetical protein QOJ23_3329 [Actinomycetota bacterium]|nr:hypothetical protein [Actinomycetota bacterium]